ncbi:Uncharacterized protein HZ326_25014 [Fusarium oxysporum f. sp. albedinis]|nr:Uncharacterized protein HZ326_25014 [Fusarium oxysporum f. sp. albedinis]
MNPATKRMPRENNKGQIRYRKSHSQIVSGVDCIKVQRFGLDGDCCALLQPFVIEEVLDWVRYIYSGFRGV